jgi:hypothetical protein
MNDDWRLETEERGPRQQGRRRGNLVGGIRASAHPTRLRELDG